MEPSDLLELIDACRPGTDDVRQPEMRALAERMEQDAGIARQYERIQRLDSAIQAAMAAGPVPEGLAARLLAAIDRAATEGADRRSDPVAAAASKPSAESERLVGREGGTGRWGRKRSVWAGLASLAAAIVAAIAFWPTNSEPIGARDMPSRVRQWADLIHRDRWQTSGFPYDEFPASPYVLPAPRRWQAIPSPGPERIVCYELTPPGEKQALLFVLLSRHQRWALPSRPRSQPDWDTQGLCIASWMERGLVYALAVEGGGARYRSVVRAAPPIAVRVFQPSPTG